MECVPIESTHPARRQRCAYANSHQILPKTDAHQRNAEKAVNKCKARLAELEKEGNDLPDVKELEAEAKKVHEEMRAYRQKIEADKKKQRTALGRIKDAESERKQSERELDVIKDDKKLRLQRLLGQRKNLKDSYAFVSQNRKMFRRPVWGPIGEFDAGS